MIHKPNSHLDEHATTHFHGQKILTRAESNMYRQVILSVVVLLACSAERSSAVIINSNTTIDSTNSFADQMVTVVDGPGGPTVVTMVNGAVVGGRTIPIAIEILGASSVIMNGGTVLSDDDDFGATVTRNSSMFTLNGGSAARVESHDSSKVQINGGRIFTDSWGILMRGASEATITGGEVIGENATLVLDAAAMRVTGGTLTGETFVQLEGNGTAVLEGGRFEATGSGIDLRGGQLTITGGQFVNAGLNDPEPAGIYAYDNGEIHIFGGDFSNYGSLIDGTGTVHFYGPGLTRLEAEFPETLDRITGKLADGNDIRFFVADGGNVVLHTIPEPSTLAFATLAAMLLLTIHCRRDARNAPGAVARREPRPPGLPRYNR
jgi:hypothetical protein